MTLFLTILALLPWTAAALAVGVLLGRAISLSDHGERQ